MKNKQLSILFLLSLSISIAISASAAEERRGPQGRRHGLELTNNQKSCLEDKLGARDSGNRPSREAMETALAACGVEKPKGPPPGEKQEPAQEETQSD
jgi:hypothetical protein